MKEEQKFSQQNNCRLERRNKYLIRGTNADYKKGTKNRCGINHDQDGKKN
jgi:hypothetical protein